MPNAWIVKLKSCSREYHAEKKSKADKKPKAKHVKKHTHTQSKKLVGRTAGQGRFADAVNKIEIREDLVKQRGLINRMRGGRF
jgi:hypothetical protein